MSAGDNLRDNLRREEVNTNHLQTTVYQQQILLFSIFYY